MRQFLLAAVTGGALIAAPQAARAVAYPLSGSHNTTQSITDGIVVATADGTYNVTTVTGDALDITSISGGTTYTDAPTTVLNAGSGGIGLSITSAGAVAVTADGDISGDAGGIFTTNSSVADTTVIVGGNVTSSNGTGIDARKTNGGGGNLVVTGTDSTAVISGSGAGDGINTSNAGVGYTTITAAGDVTGGATGDGIHAVNSNAGAAALTITANNDFTISGGVNGIYASNAGVADTTITAHGTVTGGTGAGIYSTKTNSSGGGNLTITADNTSDTISGGAYGIYANNSSLGYIQIDASGNVTATGTTGEGIYASNDAGSAAVNINTGPVTFGGFVTGGLNGIHSVNNGTAATTINAHGNVTGTNGDGILAVNTNAGSAAMTITADDVTGLIKGGVDGINATNNGSGATNVTSAGSASGTTGSGILAESDGTTPSLTIDANNSSGGVYGVGAINKSTTVTSSTDITTRGLVEGGTAGIYGESSLSGLPTLGKTINIDVTNTSLVRNLSQDSADLAVQTTSGPTLLTNHGTIQGGVQLSPGLSSITYFNTFDNYGTWSTGGASGLRASDFGLNSTNTLNNYSSGDILAANALGGAVDTTVNNADFVNNAGDIVMQNADARIGGTIGVPGDVLTFTNGGTGSFIGTGNSRLLVDASFGAGNQLSDQLMVDNVSGFTTVDVNVINPSLGAPTTGDGILVVGVDGISTTDAFALDHPVYAGLYNYQLRQGITDTQSWFLQAPGENIPVPPGGGGSTPPVIPNGIRPEAVATNMFSVLGSRTALATLSNLHDRERDVNVLSNDQQSRKGVWARAFGENNNYHSGDNLNLGFDTRLWGAQAGIDLMAKSKADGERKYAGLYVAYATSSGDAVNGSDKVATLDLNATTLGAYYTKYSAEGWYLDAVAQYSWLNGVKSQTPNGQVNSGGSSYALSLEAGRKYHPEGKIVREMQAQLIYQNTSIDDVTLSDNTLFTSSSLNAVTGRVGLRLYQNPNTGKKFLPWLRANLWHTFSKDAQLSSLGSTVGSPIGGTSAELQAGFTMGPGSKGGWNIYASGGYLFDLSGAEYSGWRGTLGVRKGW
jgi:outer membrane autotransporter protein